MYEFEVKYCDCYLNHSRSEIRLADNISDLQAVLAKAMEIETQIRYEIPYSIGVVGSSGHAYPVDNKEMKRGNRSTSS